MKDILKKLGFKHLTGPLWKHDEIGFITIQEGDKPIELVKKIYQRGYAECQLMIRSSLVIKE